MIEEVPKDSREPERSTIAKYLRYSHVGLQFFLSVGLFTAGGLWLDQRLGTVVLFTLVGLALGFAGGAFALQRDLFSKKGARREHGRDPGTEPRQKPPGNEPSDPPWNPQA